MTYPDHNCLFHIYTDMSDYQLIACTMQGRQSVAYYSCKLSSAQENYNTMGNELLAIVMVLLEYRTMLLGAEINIYTECCNVAFSSFNTQQVLRWYWFIKECSPKMYYRDVKIMFWPMSFHGCLDSTTQLHWRGRTLAWFLPQSHWTCTVTAGRDASGQSSINSEGG